MGSAVFAAQVAAQDVFTAPANKAVHVTQVIIDNVMEVVDDITVTLQDSFTAEVTNGVAVPAAVTPAKLILSALRTNLVTLPEGVGPIKILNTCQITCDVAAANTNITIVWE